MQLLVVQIFRFRHTHAREDSRLSRFSTLQATESWVEPGKEASVFGVTMNCIIFYSAVEAPCPTYCLAADSISNFST